MLGSAILDTAIGLLLIFLMMSLLCSALREALESFMKQRALDLECGIRELLQDPDGDGLARELYSHPLVFGLFTGNYQPNKVTPWTRWLKGGGKLPSYIPSSNFARALIDLEQQGRLQAPPIVAVMRALERGTGGDVETLRANVESWFDASGERIGGWYKRRTQAILFALGLATAAVLNVNPIVIGSSLFREADLRAVVVAAAEGYAAGSDAPSRASYQANLDQLQALSAAGIPMGWQHRAARGAALPVMLIGWIITAFAVTLGAPFWFDLLNKFMTVRSTVKPKAALARRASEAPRPATDAALSAALPIAVRPSVPVVAAAFESGGHVGAAAVQTLDLSSAVGDFRPHEWRDDYEEGRL